jgi:hypothetical protein
VASSGVTIFPNFVKIDQFVQRFKGGSTDSVVGDLTGPKHTFFLKKGK